MRAGQVAEHLGQPGTRRPARIGWRTVGRQQRLLGEVIAIVAGQVSRQPPDPVGLCEQLLDPDSFGSHLAR
jgi:hypothetical protein